MTVQEKLSKIPKKSLYCKLTFDNIINRCEVIANKGLDKFECPTGGLLRPEVITQLLDENLYVNTWDHNNVNGIGRFSISWDSKNIHLIPELRKSYQEKGFLDPQEPEPKKWWDIF